MTTIASVEAAVRARVGVLAKTVTVYDGAPAATPPPISANDPRVKAYIAWWGGSDAGETTAEPIDPTGSADDTWTGMLTVAAGIPTHLGTVVAALKAGLHFYDLGPSAGLLRVSYISEMRQDRSETPSRFYRLIELTARTGT